MGFFKKLARGIGKLAKKALPVVAKGIASNVPGGTHVLKAVKAVGAAVRSKKVAAIKLQPASVRGLITKHQITAPGKINAPKVTVAMPGGAPIPGGTGKRRKRVKVKRAGSSNRKPPSGGLNLKALSASWRAAGKPGTWQQWIASHK